MRILTQILNKDVLPWEISLMKFQKSVAFLFDSQEKGNIMKSLVFNKF